MTASVDFHDLVHRLKSEGEPFAIATVVRTLSVTSAKAGAKAVIMGDGTISGGWIGGGCARSAVLTAARKVIEDGVPRLVSLQPEDLLDEQGYFPGDYEDGVSFAKNMCPSKGSMEIFVEAIRPRPELVIFGASPVAIALSNLARPLGFSITVCAERQLHPLFSNVDTLLENEAVPPSNARQFFVIATQGSGDEAALIASLHATCDYVGFVASRKKFASFKEKLVRQGTDERLFAKIKAPAGLDLKAITPEEIALSILAEIIVVRRTGQTPVLQPAQVTSEEQDKKSEKAGLFSRLASTLGPKQRRDHSTKPDHSVELFLKMRGICC